MEIRDVRGDEKIVCQFCGGNMRRTVLNLGHSDFNTIGYRCDYCNTKAIYVTSEKSDVFQLFTRIEIENMKEEPK